MIIFNYIFKQITTTTLSVTSSIFIMIWLIQSLRQIDLVIENGASLRDFLILSFLPSPLWLMMIFPIGSLLAVIILFQRLEADKETLVMRFSGMGAFKIIKPIFIFCLLNVIFLSFLSFFVVPKAYNLFKSKQFELRNNISQILLREGVFLDLQSGLTIFVEKKNSRYNMSGIFIFDSRNPKQEIDISAKEGSILFSYDGPILELSEGHRRVVDENGNILSELSFSNYSMSITNKNERIHSRWLDSNEKSILDLLTENDPTSFADGHYRICLPLLSLTLPLIALILILCVRDHSKNHNFQITVSLIFALIIQISLISIRKAVIIEPSFWIGFYVITIFPIVFFLVFALFFETKQRYLIKK